jgi:toxin secretion/phage lysis holin
MKNNVLRWYHRKDHREEVRTLKVLDCYNTIAGVIVTLLSAAFGTYWYIFAALILLNIFDWLTGWYKARKKKTESSAVGFKGIIKKLGYWVIVAMAFLIADVFALMGRDILSMDLDFLMLIGWFTLASLMVNEARSILENLVECGYEVPAVLIRGLVVTERLLDQEKEK